MSEAKLLVFGSGFISGFIIEEAVKNGFSARLLYNNHRMEQIPDVDQFSLAEVSPLQVLQEYRPDYIVCLQGNSFVPDNKNLRNSIETNLIVPLSALESIAIYADTEKKLKKIIIVGSAGEYGRSYAEPIAETFPLHPSSIYGLTKIFLYNMAIYYKEKGLPIVYTRQFNCTGPGQRSSFLIPSLCRQIASIEKEKSVAKIEIGDLSQERDFIDVRDASRAYIHLLMHGAIGEVYNIGSGVVHSVKQVLDEILRVSDLNADDVEISINRQLFFKEQSISNRILADVTKLAALGFRHQVPFEKTIHDTLEYWRGYVK